MEGSLSRQLSHFCAPCAQGGATNRAQEKDCGLTHKPATRPPQPRRRETPQSPDRAYHAFSLNDAYRQ